MIATMLLLSMLTVALAYPSSYTGDITAFQPGDAFMTDRMGVTTFETAQGAVCAISSNVPAGGYVVGNTYDFTVTTNDADGYGMLLKAGGSNAMPSTKTGSHTVQWVATNDLSMTSYAICARVRPSAGAYVAAAFTVDSACGPVCGANQWEKTPCTLSGPRVCLDCTAQTCTGTQFKTACSASADETCTDLTVCNATEFESVAASSTTDRTCSALTVCNATQYESVAASATTDRTCSALTVCNGTEFESAAASATTDRMCSALTVCNATEFESVAASATADRTCSALTVCTGTQFESASAQATTDRVCSACSPVENASSPVSCTGPMNSQVTECAAGFWLDGNATADVCVGCKAVVNCSTGQYLSGRCPGNSTSDVTECMEGVAPVYEVEMVLTFVSVTEDDLENIAQDVADTYNLDVGRVTVEILSTRRRRDSHGNESNATNTGNESNATNTAGNESNATNTAGNESNATNTAGNQSNESNATNTDEVQVKVTIQVSDEFEAAQLQSQILETPPTWTKLLAGNPAASPVGRPTVTFTVVSQLEATDDDHDGDDDGVVVAVSVISVLIFVGVLVLLFRAFAKADAESVPDLEMH